MPRAARNAPGGLVYHVINRANGRLRLFKKDEDFQAFLRVLVRAHQQVPIRILDWCVMGNHWHLVLWPVADGELTKFMRQLTLTHAQRWKAAHSAVGLGHLYQGRFKSFPIQDDEHLLTVLRYVQRNPLRAKLVRRAQDWRWGSCHVRQRRRDELNKLLCDWPIERPNDWVREVNAPQDASEAKAVQESIRRGRPFGSDAWVARIATSLKLTQTLRPPGRQKGWRKRRKTSPINPNPK